MITIVGDQLTFRFPEVHRFAKCRIVFQRTLRIPDDDGTYPPSGEHGQFPLRHLDDFADRLPRESVRRGGVIMPIHQAEAMWVKFEDWGAPYPCAIKIATGKVCAISGEPWREGLIQDPQNYVVVPGQPWLDGYCVEKGWVRRFVAMPLGDGHTVEEQLTGQGTYGGLQVAVYPMKSEVYEDLKLPEPFSGVREEPARYYGMGLAPGGLFRQEIYEDRFGLDVWDRDHGVRCFVTMANSTQWMAITGERPPTRPPTAHEYAEAGLPWFLYYDGDREALAGAERLAGLRSVGETARGGEAMSAHQDGTERERP